MTSLTSPSEWLARFPRAVSRNAILARFTRHSLDRDLRSGRIVRILPNTYLAIQHAATFEGRSSAALLWAGPRVTLGGTSAAYAHRLIPQPPDYITLCSPKTKRLRGPAWIRVIQPTPAISVPPVDARGLRVTPVPDTLLQVWAELGTRVGDSDHHRGRAQGPHPIERSLGSRIRVPTNSLTARVTTSSRRGAGRGRELS